MWLLKGNASGELLVKRSFTIDEGERERSGEQEDKGTEDDSPKLRARRERRSARQQRAQVDAILDEVLSSV